MVLWLLDVGNTRLKWASYQMNGTPQGPMRPIKQDAIFLEHVDKLASEVWAGQAKPHRILGCSVASQGVREAVQEQLELLEIWNTERIWLVPREQERSLINGYDYPSRLGADRWMALHGAKRVLLTQGRLESAVVVMVGTAVTIDAMELMQGESDAPPVWKFIGGLILPGHGTMLKALHTGTSGLHVPTGQVVDFPSNTSDALTSGGTMAIAGAIEIMRQRLASRTGRAPACLISGGAAWKMLPSLAFGVEMVEHLVFEGLLDAALADGNGL